MDQQRSPTLEEESLLACGWDPDLQMEACPRTPPPGLVHPKDSGASGQRAPWKLAWCLRLCPGRLHGSLCLPRLRARSEITLSITVWAGLGNLLGGGEGAGEGEKMSKDTSLGTGCPLEPWNAALCRDPVSLGALVAYETVLPPCGHFW